MINDREIKCFTINWTPNKYTYKTRTNHTRNNCAHSSNSKSSVITFGAKQRKIMCLLQLKWDHQLSSESLSLSLSSVCVCNVYFMQIICMKTIRCKSLIRYVWQRTDYHRKYKPAKFTLLHLCKLVWLFLTHSDAAVFSSFLSINCLFCIAHHIQMMNISSF